MLKRLGADPRILAPTDLVTAMKLEVVEAAHGLTPSADRNLGLGAHAKHTYWPAWHHQGGLIDLVVNRAAWDSLTPRLQAAVRTVCDGNLRHAVAATEDQFESLKALQKAGFEAKPWPENVWTALRRAWGKEVVTQSTKDADFSKAYRSAVAFRDSLEIWQELSRLPERQPETTPDSKDEKAEKAPAKTPKDAPQTY